MSTINIVVFVVIFVTGCFGSWRAALGWSNRTRDANKEDPRDQEIRELNATLSVARKDVDTLKKSSGSQGFSITELQEKLQKTGDALADTKQKYNATKENLDKEIEDRGELEDELRQLRGDVGRANVKIHEFEVQVGMNNSQGSGFVAGLDDMVEDDDKEAFTIRQEHRLMKEHVQKLETQIEELTAESERWKKHCAVMTNSNKSLKARVEEMTESEKKIEALEQKAAALVELQTAHSTLEQKFTTNTAELESANSQLGLSASKLESVRKDLQDKSAKFVELQVSHENLEQEATARASEFESATSDVESAHGELEAVRKDLAHAQQVIETLETAKTSNIELQSQMDEMQAQMGDFDKLQQEKDSMRSRIETMNMIQDENDKLLNVIQELKESDDSGNQGLQEENKRLQEDNRQLSVRVGALDKIESENETLQTNTKSLRDLQHKNEKLVAQIDELKESANALSAAKEKQRQHEAELGSLRAQLKQLDDVTADNAKLQTELSELQQSKEEADELQMQVAELSKSGDKVEELRDQIVELAACQAIADEHLTQEQQENSRLRKKLEDLSKTDRNNENAQTEIEEQLCLEQEETRLLSDRIASLQAELTASKSATEAFDDVQPEHQAVSPAADESDEADDTEELSDENTDSLPVLDPDSYAASEDGLQDDLQLIKGVGAKLAEKLNTLGIRNFRSLMELTPEDYERAQEIIPSLQSRIKRDKWLNQARRLHKQKYNESL
jgi:predicted flap endonuclease-1-like 5' DNA nuclease